MNGYIDLGSLRVPDIFDRQLCHKFTCKFRTFANYTDSKRPATVLPLRAFWYELQLLLVTAFETVYTTTGIHQFVFAGIKWVRGA